MWTAGTYNSGWQSGHVIGDILERCIHPPLCSQKVLFFVACSCPTQASLGVGHLASNIRLEKMVHWPSLKGNLQWSHRHCCMWSHEFHPVFHSHLLESGLAAWEVKPTNRRLSRLIHFSFCRHSRGTWLGFSRFFFLGTFPIFSIKVIMHSSFCTRRQQR